MILFGIVGYAAFRWDSVVSRALPRLVAPRDSVTIARGEFLYKKSIGCWFCHGNGRDGGAPSGGMKFDLTTLSPSLGVYYAANITPDVAIASLVGAVTELQIALCSVTAQKT